MPGLGLMEGAVRVEHRDLLSLCAGLRVHRRAGRPGSATEGSRGDFNDKSSGRSVLGGALVPHRLELGRTGTAVGELGGGQGLPLPLPDSWESGECREGSLFGHPPCMIFTVFVSRDFSSMDVS